MSETVVELPDPGYQDFFSPFVGYDKYTLPDGLQTITFKIMNEGDRMEYQRKTNRPISIDRKSDTASIRPDVAADRLELILTTVTDWNLFMRKHDTGEWVPVVFTKANLNNWVRTTNPKIVTDLERAIQKANPWMMAEMTVEEIDAEISNLQDLRDRRVREEAEKNS